MSKSFIGGFLIGLLVGLLLLYLFGGLYQTKIVSFWEYNSIAVVRINKVTGTIKVRALTDEALESEREKFWVEVK